MPARKKAVVEETPVQEVEGTEEVQEPTVSEKAEAIANTVSEAENMTNADGKELLFPDGPTIDQVEQWKSMFNDEVYISEFDDDVYIWRPIKRKEYKDISKIDGADNFYREERICERALLWPEGYNYMKMSTGKAGVPTLLAEFIMEKSGFQAKTTAMRI